MSLDINRSYKESEKSVREIIHVQSSNEKWQLKIFKARTKMHTKICDRDPNYEGMDANSTSDEDTFVMFGISILLLKKKRNLQILLEDDSERKRK